MVHWTGFIGAGTRDLRRACRRAQISDKPEHRLYHAVNKFLPFSYPATGGVLSAVSTLFAKGAGELLKTSILDGNNQFTSGETYVIVAIFAITAVGQVLLRRPLARALVWGPLDTDSARLMCMR